MKGVIAIETVRELARKFAISGEISELEPLKRGHINDTFVSVSRDGSRIRRYVHQRINHQVFKNVPGLMDNVTKVIAHVQHKLTELGSAAQDRTLNIIPTIAGSSYLQDATGNFWRTYDYLEGTESFYVCKDAAQACEGAGACGRFQMYLLDLNPKDFIDTIPLFHNTPNRYKLLSEAVSQDAHQRVSSAEAELKFVENRAAEARRVVTALEGGELPWRVTHNDTKFNNVLFDLQSHKAVAIVDLDTCMPGSPLYDFGDLVRTAGVPANEDEKDLSKVFLDQNLFAGLARGYLGALGTKLAPLELELMSYAPRLITLTIGLRFLTDYINGDIYFKTEYPEHNLVRARNQFKIVSSMEEKALEMEQIVRSVQ